VWIAFDFSDNELLETVLVIEFAYRVDPYTVVLPQIEPIFIQSRY
jgi:hypothetical protein